MAKTRNEENHTAQQGESCGRADAFHTLIVTYSRQIQDEADESCGDERKPVDGDSCRRHRGIHEQSDQPFRTIDEKQGNRRAAHHGSQQRDPLRCRHTAMQSRTEIVTDDGLRRLRDGVADHEDERHVIASYSEGAHAVIAQIAHEYLIADEYEHGHRTLAQQCRRTDAALVADVAQRQTQALTAPFEHNRAQVPCAE